MEPVGHLLGLRGVEQEFRHGNLVLVLRADRLPLRVFRLDVRVERPHAGQGLEVGVQRHHGDLDDLVVAGPRAGGLQVHGRHQAAVQVDQAGVDDGISHGGSSSSFLAGLRGDFAAGW